MYNRRPPLKMTPKRLERFMEQVEVDAETGCWMWTKLKGKWGYGKFGNRYAHVVAYEHFVGPVPEDRVLGHTCENACVNYQHVRPVTQLANVREGNTGRYNKDKTHCPRGHEYVPFTTYVNPRGHRACKLCHHATPKFLREYKEWKAKRNGNLPTE